MGGFAVAPTLIEFIADRTAGDRITIGAIERKTRLTARQIQASMGRLIRAGHIPAKVIVRGQIWEVTSAAEVSAMAEVPPDDRPATGASANGAAPAAAQAETVTFRVVRRIGAVLVLTDPEGWLWAAERLGVADDAVR